MTPVRDPEPHLATAADAGPLPGRAHTLRDELADVGVPLARMADAEALVYRTAFTIAGESVRKLALALGGSTSGVALRRVILGAEGRTLEQDAEEAGTDRATLARAEARTRARLSRKLKTGLRPRQ